MENKRSPQSPPQEPHNVGRNRHSNKVLYDTAWEQIECKRTVCFGILRRSIWLRLRSREVGREGFPEDLLSGLACKTLWEPSRIRSAWDMLEVFPSRRVGEPGKRSVWPLWRKIKRCGWETDYERSQSPNVYCLIHMEGTFYTRVIPGTAGEGSSKFCVVMSLCI